MATFGAVLMAVGANTYHPGDIDGDIVGSFGGAAMVVGLPLLTAGILTLVGGSARKSRSFEALDPVNGAFDATATAWQPLGAGDGQCK